MRVRFFNVGRDKKSWTCEIDTPNLLEINAALHAGKALRSRASARCAFSEDNTRGLVLAGVRVVGTFRIEER